MSDIRLVEAPLEICFDTTDANEHEYEREYNIIREGHDDAMSRWLRTAKAKGETNESDPVVLQLITELYRKMERLEQLITNTMPKRILLSKKASIEKIGFEYFELSEPLMKPEEHYYGRLDLPVYPQREVPFFFEALTPSLAKIVRMHPRDEDEWGAYMTYRERIMIRHLKGYE